MLKSDLVSQKKTLVSLTVWKGGYICLVVGLETCFDSFNINHTAQN